MLDKTISAVMLVLSLCLAGNAFADTTTWTGHISTAWEVAGNWDARVPDEQTDAVIGVGSGTVDLTRALEIHSNFNGSVNRAKTLTMDEGVLNMGDELYVGQWNGASSVFTQTGGALNMSSAPRDWIRLQITDTLYEISGGSLAGHGCVVMDSDSTMKIGGTASVTLTNPLFAGHVGIPCLAPGGWWESGNLIISGSNATIDVQSFGAFNDSSLTYEFDSGGISRVDVTDTAELSGTLDLIDLGYAASGTYTVLTADYILNNGIVLAAGVDPSLWAFAIVGTGAIDDSLDELQVTYVGGTDPLALAVSYDGGSDELTFTWDSQLGRLYNLRSATDLSTDPAGWPIWDGHQDIEANPPEDTLTIALPPESARFFVVEVFPAPPVSVFSDDFEGGLGDWTTGGDPGSDPFTNWEFGSPSNVGPASAHSPANCFGTNIDDNYEVSANIWLRSPPIDLTTAGGATLNFWQFADIELDFDAGQVSVLDAADDSNIADIGPPLDGTTPDWEKISRSIPGAALGKSVKIEFRFQSDDFLNYAGWYVDDVEVTVP